MKAAEKDADADALTLTSTASADSESSDTLVAIQCEEDNNGDMQWRGCWTITPPEGHQNAKGPHSHISKFHPAYTHPHVQLFIYTC